MPIVGYAQVESGSYLNSIFSQYISTLTIRSFSDERLYPFEDIVRVDVLPGLVGTSYAVRTRAGSLQFSSLLGGHERLCSLIVQRAGLA